jgi:hypothetical protein
LILMKLFQALNRCPNRGEEAYQPDFPKRQYPP